jgi:hypothetical protein
MPNRTSKAAGMPPKRSQACRPQRRRYPAAHQNNFFESALVLDEAPGPSWVFPDEAPHGAMRQNLSCQFGLFFDATISAGPQCLAAYALQNTKQLPYTVSITLVLSNAPISR